MLTVHCVTCSVNVLYLSNIPSPSHFIWCKALLTALHERGYNITALSPDVEESKENFSYYHLEKVYAATYNGSTEMNFIEMGKLSFLEMYLGFAFFIEAACESALKSNGYQQILDFPDDFKFDLIVYDFTMSQCLLGIVHKYKNVPMVSVTPFLFSNKVAQLSGSLMFPGFVPSPNEALSQTMNFKDRLISALQQSFEIVFDGYYLEPMMNKYVQKRHPGIPHIDEIEKKATKMIMVNTQPITDYKTPALPNVKLVGGLQVKKVPSPLPLELKTLADAATNGLVLFSLGTNARSDQLDEGRIITILKSFERLPQYTFLWKFETAEKLPIKLPKNVKIQSWMPQNDILAHPNTRLFISHCGLLSTQEALSHGVPVLGFPIFADQPQNSFRLKELGVGETLSIYDLDENEFYETVKKLLEDPTYKARGKAISAALHDQPMSPLDEAIYWTEWVLRHPDINLSSPSANLSIFVRHSLDVITIFFIVIMLMLLLWVKIIKFLIRICTPTKKITVDKKKKRN